MKHRRRVIEDAFIDQQEWRLHEHVETSTKCLSSPFTPSQNQHPAFSATCEKIRSLRSLHLHRIGSFRSGRSTSRLLLLERLFPYRNLNLCFIDRANRIALPFSFCLVLHYSHGFCHIQCHLQSSTESPSTELYTSPHGSDIQMGSRSLSTDHFLSHDISNVSLSLSLLLTASRLSFPPPG